MMTVTVRAHAGAGASCRMPTPPAFDADEGSSLVVDDMQPSEEDLSETSESLGPYLEHLPLPRRCLRVGAR